MLELLRGALGVRGVPLGCRDGSCGACRVVVDGALVKSCALGVEALGDAIDLELPDDVAEDPASAKARAAFDDARPTRCAMCSPALGLTAAWLARQPPAARGAALDEAMRGAACACTGRRSLRRALET